MCVAHLKNQWNALTNAFFPALKKWEYQRACSFFYCSLKNTVQTICFLLLLAWNLPKDTWPTNVFVLSALPYFAALWLLFLIVFYQTLVWTAHEILILMRMMVETRIGVRTERTPITSAGLRYVFHLWTHKKYSQWTWTWLNHVNAICTIYILEYILQK